MKEIIKGFGGNMLGTVETDFSGNVTVRSFGGSIVATYNASDNTTRAFGGKIVAWGNVASGFLLKGLI